MFTIQNLQKYWGKYKKLGRMAEGYTQTKNELNTPRHLFNFITVIAPRFFSIKRDREIEMTS